MMLAAVSGSTMFATESTRSYCYNPEPVSEKEGAARLADGDRTGKRKRTNAQEPVATNAGVTSGTSLA